MAAALFGFSPPFLSLLLRHQWDNEQALDKWVQSLQQAGGEAAATRLTVIHGKQDEIVPCWMGQQLAERVERQGSSMKATLNPTHRFVRVAAHHNDIFEVAETHIFQEMAGHGHKDASGAGKM